MKFIYALVIALAFTVAGWAQTTANLAAYTLTMENVTKQYQVLIDIARQAANDANLKREFQDWSTRVRSERRRGRVRA